MHSEKFKTQLMIIFPNGPGSLVRGLIGEFSIIIMTSHALMPDFEESKTQGMQAHIPAN